MFGHTDSNRFASCRIAMASRESETGIFVLIHVLRERRDTAMSLNEMVSSAVCDKFVASVTHVRWNEANTV